MEESPERQSAEQSGTSIANPEQSTPPDPSTRNRGAVRVFVGPHGIRAGWSILIFAAILLGLAVGISALVRLVYHPKFHPGGEMSPSVGLISEGLQFLSVAIATWVMSRIERKPALFYGYQGSGRGLRFFSGLVWGFGAISALVFSLVKLGYLVIDGWGLAGQRALYYAAAWGLMFLLVGLFEESLLRGYLQYTVTRGIGFWWGATILSFVFGFGHGHNPGESPIGLFSAGAIGLVFCLSLWYTGSLWWAVGFHAAWDWGESYFYGTADSGLTVRGHLLREHPVGSILWSGGSTGPEGSLLILPLVLGIALLMWVWWGRRERSPFGGMGWRPPKPVGAVIGSIDS